MESKRSLPTILLLAIGIIGIFVLANYLMTSHSLPSLSEYMASSSALISAAPSPTMTAAVSVPEFMSLRTPKGAIQVLVATSSADQERGLGGRASLPADQGMLFVFPVPGSYAFWMKDMEFPLDIVWIGSDEVVAGVTSGIPADSFPSTYLPPRPISYVLELNAGAAEKYGIGSGTPLTFSVH